MDKALRGLVLKLQCALLQFDFLSVFTFLNKPKKRTVGMEAQINLQPICVSWFNHIMYA